MNQPFSLTPTTEKATENVIRPSALKMAMTCPHRWYLDFTATEAETKAPSAAAVGTAVHAASECYWTKLCGVGGPDTPVRLDINEAVIAMLVKHAQDTFDPNDVVWAPEHNEETARQQIETGVKSYFTHIVPTMGIPLAVEKTFGVEFRVKGVDTVYTLQGTVDLLYPECIMDIKTRMGNKKSRVDSYALQQSVYVWLAQKNGYTGCTGVRIHQLLLGDGRAIDDSMFINIRRIEPMMFNLIKRLEAVQGRFVNAHGEAYESVPLSPEIAFPGNTDHFLCNKNWCDHHKGCQFSNASAPFVPNLHVGSVGHDIQPL